MYLTCVFSGIWEGGVDEVFFCVCVKYNFRKVNNAARRKLTIWRKRRRSPVATRSSPKVALTLQSILGRWGQNECFQNSSNQYAVENSHCCVRPGRTRTTKD